MYTMDYNITNDDGIDGDAHIIHIESSEDMMVRYNNLYIESNSPMASNPNSDVEEYPETFNLSEDIVQHAISKKKLSYRKISFEEIERSLSKYYDKNNKYSNEIDILITYMKGQKHLFSEANYVTLQKLYALLFTAIGLTTFISVFSPFIQYNEYNAIVVSSCNAIATLLLAILRFLQLESACNTYSLLSTMYDKFENSLEFANNKLIFMENESEQNALVLEKIKEIEFKMSESKDLCPIMVPEEVKSRFPIIYYTNIFRFIKKMELYRKNLIIKFRDIKNEIRYILYKWNLETDSSSPAEKEREKRRLIYLMDMKEKTKAELIEYKNTYNQIITLIF